MVLLNLFFFVIPALMINQNSVLKMREPSELLIISSRARKAKAAIGEIY